MEAEPGKLVRGHVGAQAAGLHVLSHEVPDPHRRGPKRGPRPRSPLASGVNEPGVRGSTMGPGLRKGCLTVHLACSVGWLGAVAASLALGVAGVTSGDAPLVRAVYLTMEWTGS